MNDSVALGLFELESLARGIVVADALFKKARIHVEVAEAVSPGKYLLVFSGPVAEVDESFQEGIKVAGPVLLDKLYLPAVEPRLLGALRPNPRLVKPSRDDALGIVETHTAASTLLAADTALKRAHVDLVQFHVAKGIGGKGWFTLSGAQHDVESALEQASAAIEATLLVTTELIERPHAELATAVLPKG